MEALHKVIVYGRANQDNEIIRVNAVIIKEDEEGEEAAPNVRARALNRSAYSAGACRKPSAPETDSPARSSGKSGVKCRSRSAFVTTKTEENAMAPAASIGDRRMPKAG